MKINRSVGSVLEFQQNEPQNQQKFVPLMNNKVAAISKTMGSSLEKNRHALRTCGTAVKQSCVLSSRRFKLSLRNI